MCLVYETPRLLVRAFEPADVEDCYEWLADPEIARYRTGEPLDREQARALINDVAAMELHTPGAWNEYAVVFRQNGRVIGNVSLFIDGSPSAQYELGYRLTRAYHGRGLATEAVHPLIGLAFSLGAHRVFATVDARNTASARLCEKLGMRQEAHLLQIAWVKGEWRDELVYAMLAPEYHPASAL